MTREADDDLARLFRPRSIALVGATERSIWSNSAFGNLDRLGFPGVIHLVNRKGGTIYGRAAATSCTAVGEAIDAALLMVPEAALIDAIADLGAAGVAGAVLLSAGFAETGPDGVARQRRLAEAARAANVRLLGPNCLGFVNHEAAAPLWTTMLRAPLADRNIAIVSQSGATAAQIAQFAHHQQVGITHMISTGNEADIDIADAIDFLCGEPAVRAIALFLESARRPGAFVAAVARASAAGKAIVVLKAGASEVAAQAAQAHTGALVGDDRMFDAACRRLGMVRVRSIEALVTTADLIARVGPVATPGLALVAMSGGLCEIGMDQAAHLGVAIPPLASTTLARLRDALPAFGAPANPLDVTGAVMLEPTLIAKALSAIAEDPAIGLVSFLFDAPVSDDEARITEHFLRQIGAGFAVGGKPAVMISPSFMPVNDASLTVCRATAVRYSGAGLSHGLAAIGALFNWSQVSARQHEPRCTPAAVAARPVGERQVLAYLADRGVPVVPAKLVLTATEASAAAEEIGEPVALKIASDIAHKTEIGGVLLNIAGAVAAADAFEAIVARVALAAPEARVEGVLVSPMRRGGIELFVGTTRDPQWGPAVAVGFGGVLVELLADTSLRLLPVDRTAALDMLRELRGTALLDGFRGSGAIDREALADIIVAIGNAALALGEDLISLEVNPLLINEDRIEALDGLAVWSTPPAGT